VSPAAVGMSLLIISDMPTFAVLLNHSLIVRWVDQGLLRGHRSPVFDWFISLTGEQDSFPRARVLERKFHVIPGNYALFPGLFRTFPIEGIVSTSINLEIRPT
jgi:hypothetical protein